MNDDEDIPTLAPSLASYDALSAEAGEGEQIGRYRVLDHLGMGGMAEVLLAEQAGPGGFAKKVVIKRSLPHLRRNPRIVEMFLREARLAARFNHPNIVQIYELGQEGDDYFIAMEHIDGLSLQRLARRAWARGERVPLEVSLRAIADAAVGLAHAHEARDDDGAPLGLVHRDVSPDNLMIMRGEGVTKILDFGVARADEAEPLTRSGELKGKVPFMSPEQVAGEPLDHRADLYALGVSLYWLLARELPFKAASDFKTLAAILEERPRPPSSLNPEVSPELDALVLRMLEKRPADRPASGREIASALEAMLPAGRDRSRVFVEEALAWDDAGAASVTVPSHQLAPLDETTAGETVTDQASPRARRRGVLVAAALALVLVPLALLLLPRLFAPPLPPVAAVTEPSPPPSPPAEPPAAPAEAPVEDPAPIEPSRRARARSTRARKRVETVRARAPAGVVWKIGARVVGRGAGELEVPRGARRLTAVNAAVGHEAAVPVVEGVADYGALPEAEVDFRIFPFAEVTLGRKKLGTSPMSVTLPVGKHRASLRYQDQSMKVRFEVRAGERTLVKRFFK